MKLFISELNRVMLMEIQIWGFTRYEGELYHYFIMEGSVMEIFVCLKILVQRWMFLITANGMFAIVQLNRPSHSSWNFGLDCYEYMFSGCTSLTQAPELPATTLSYMATVPEITLTQTQAYFQLRHCLGMCSELLGCTSLTQAPESRDISWMLFDVQRLYILTQVPNFQLTLASNCYYCMLQLYPLTPSSRTSSWDISYHCSACSWGSSLTQAPESRWDISLFCYNGMFRL